MKVLKKLLVCIVLFALIANLSGCFILDDIEEHRNQMEEERRQRIDAIQSEADYDYVIYTTELIQVVINSETKIYDVENDIAQNLLSDKIAGSNPNNSIIDSYTITGEKDKAYIRVKYHTYEEEVPDKENNFSFDIALISFEYSTGKSELVYDFKNVLSPQNSTMRRYEYPRVCDIADENFAVLYENGEIKVVDLQTKEITYAHRVCEETDRDFYRLYASSGKYLDYIADGIYYEYTSGTFVPHEFNVEFNIKYIQDGRVDDGTSLYVYRLGEYLCCDAEEKAIHLATGEKASYEEVRSEARNETSDYGNAFQFYQNGKKYYRTYSNAILNAEKDLIVQFNRDYFENSEDDTIQQLMLFYDGETKYTPDEIEIKVTNGRCFVFCEYEFPHLGWMEEIGPFIFEYDLQTNELKYIDYWKYFGTLLSHNINSIGFSVLTTD